MEPEVYGRYTLLQSIGRGGMAEVFLARSEGLAGVGRRLAIKRIHPQFTSDENFVKMFIDEARIVGHFHHPNIVQLVDFGQIGSSYYIAMEYVDGVNVANIMGHALKNRRRMPPEAIIEIGIQFGQGMDYAHRETDQNGEPLRIVHRDLTPHNILVAKEGSVKITDFGIAKASMNTHMTQAGMIKGKVPYMSPEQAMGQPLDNRSDIFSIGIILYEMCTLKRLFQGPSDFHVLQKVIAAEVPSIREQNEEIPEELERIIMKLLTADREARYQSAGEMADDMRRLKFSMGERFSRFRINDYVTQVTDAIRNKKPAAPARGNVPRPRRPTGRAPQNLGRPDALGAMGGNRQGFNIPSTRSAAPSPNADEATRLINTGELKREAVEEADHDSTETVLANPQMAKALRAQLRNPSTAPTTRMEVPSTRSAEVDSASAPTFVPGVKLPPSEEPPTTKMSLDEATLYMNAVPKSQPAPENLAQETIPPAGAGPEQSLALDETAQTPITPPTPISKPRESSAKKGGIRPIWVVLAILALLGAVVGIFSQGPAPATLSIQGSPAGATVVINGQVVTKKGQYTLTEAPTDQSIKVVVKKKGFESHKQTVNLSEGQQVMVTYDLQANAPAPEPEKPAMGQLKLESTPSGATIVVAGQPTDWVTPVEIPLVAGENHTLSFQLEGYTAQEKTYQVRAGESRTESVTLVPVAP